MYRDFPAYTLVLLNSILEDGEPGRLLIAPRDVTKAFGRDAGCGGEAELNPMQMYRTVSAVGNPALNTLTVPLMSIGLQPAVERVKAD